MMYSIHLFPLFLYQDLPVSVFFSFVPTRGLADHAILDILDDNRGLGVEGFYLNPPEGDDSDGYDNSGTEEGDPDASSRNLLQVCIYQCSGSMNIWCGSGTADPCL
jgi:hypothetical protein